MIRFKMYNDLYIQVNCKDRDYIRGVEDHLTEFIKNFMYSPKYISGQWDGKISLFRRGTRSFPYGLFLDVLRFSKKEFPDYPITITDGVKSMFRGIDPKDLKYNLIHQPYNYQQECIESLISKGKGICVVATAGGKSLIIGYLISNIDELFDNKSLIIVPTLQLVDQFKGDLIEYGFSEDRIGMVNSKSKEFHKPIVISTWQSLQNQMDKLPLFDTVIVDEVHTTQATVLQEILQNCTSAQFRFGVTGTLPNNRLDEMNVRGFIGPVLKTFRGRDLADLGFISKCTIKMIEVTYNEEPDGDYQEIKSEVFTKEYRIGLIKHLITITNNTILILVDKVEKEGVILEEILKESFPKKEVVFLSGRDKSSVRDGYRTKMDTDSNMVVIATYQIFQAGVNIKSLRTIILASSTKSFIRVIQSLGRVLRKHVSKDLGGAELYDIVDNCKYLLDHGEKRHSHYTKERHKIIETKLNEGSNTYELFL